MKKDMVGKIAPPTGMMSNFVTSLFLSMHSAISSPLVEAICRCRRRRLDTKISALLVS